MTDQRQPFEGETEYRVKLTRPVTFLGSRMRPIDEHTMRGDILNALVDQEGADCVDTAFPR